MCVIKFLLAIKYGGELPYLWTVLFNYIINCILSCINCIISELKKVVL